jgi:hypothetical protein
MTMTAREVIEEQVCAIIEGCKIEGIRDALIETFISGWNASQVACVNVRERYLILRIRVSERPDETVPIEDCIVIQFKYNQV